jgi:hypothetical protein
VTALLDPSRRSHAVEVQPSGHAIPQPPLHHDNNSSLAQHRPSLTALLVQYHSRFRYAPAPYHSQVHNSLVAPSSLVHLLLAPCVLRLTLRSDQILGCFTRQYIPASTYPILSGPPSSIHNSTSPPSNRVGGLRIKNPLIHRLGLDPDDPYSARTAQALLRDVIGVSPTTSTPTPRRHLLRRVYPDIAGIMSGYPGAGYHGAAYGAPPQQYYP